ncbi:hypothetical protein [Streptomyces sp. NPDC004100]
MSQPQKRADRHVLRYQLPTVRTRLPDQLDVALAVGRHTGVFTSRQLEVPGVSDHRKGLVIGFLHSCGMLMRGGGRGVYRATPAARRMAEAWGRSETFGRRELAIVLDSTWFAGIAREELGEHGGQRVALANRLLAAARAPETRRGEVEILIMWLLEARLILPVHEGYVRWNADASVAVSTEESEPAMTATREESVTRAGDRQQGCDDASVTKLPGTSQQVGPELSHLKRGPHTAGTDQTTAADLAVDSAQNVARRDPNSRPDTTLSFEGTSVPPLSEHPHAAASRARIAEDEMLDSDDASDATPTQDGGSTLRGDAIPPQTPRSAGAPSAQPTSQLTELAHLGDLAGQPIMLHELLRLSEEELLSMYRGLRRFIDVSAGARDSSLRP